MAFNNSNEDPLKTISSSETIKKKQILTDYHWAAPDVPQDLHFLIHGNYIELMVFQLFYSLIMKDLQNQLQPGVLPHPWVSSSLNVTPTTTS